MTATTAGPELRVTLAEHIASIGPYPHGRLNASDRPGKKQTTRMLKAACAVTGYTVRLTKKWIDDEGAPLCPCCQTVMTLQQKGT
jgi:hypothetical protein